MLDGQYSNPVQVVAFNTSEHWSRDVSEDVARELRCRCDQEGRELPSCLRDFVERSERGPPVPRVSSAPNGVLNIIRLDRAGLLDELYENVTCAVPRHMLENSLRPSSGGLEK
jgi:hypothetical protein